MKTKGLVRGKKEWIRILREECRKGKYSIERKGNGSQKAINGDIV